jgi:hypothetical protein
VLLAWATNTLTDTNHTGIPDVVLPYLASGFNPRTLPKGNGNALASAPAPVSVPALPDWAAILLGSLLLGAMWQVQRRPI